MINTEKDKDDHTKCVVYLQQMFPYRNSMEGWEYWTTVYFRIISFYRRDDME